MATTPKNQATPTAHDTKTLTDGKPLAPRLVVRYADEESVAQAAAQRILIKLSDILATPGHENRADFAVTGGGDGIHVLELMLTNPLLTSVDWSRVHIWWGDERFVPEDDPDRNAKQAREGLFNELVARGLLPESNIHEMGPDTRDAATRAAATDAEDQAAADVSAAAYEKELREELGDANGADPRLDIALFGVGPDGHFASLFPGHEEVKIVDGRLATGVINSPKPPSLRVSLTVPMIQRSHAVWVIASSAHKTAAMHKALPAINDPMVPVSHAAGTDSTVWMGDMDAAPKE
jgi:6-phosphogluconolactonase